MPPFFPSFFLPLLPPFFPSSLFFPPSLLLSFLSSFPLFCQRKMCHFFLSPDANLYFQGGGGLKYKLFIEPKNPPSFLSSFFSIFLLTKNVSFFFQPLIQICTCGGMGGAGKVLIVFQPKNTFTFLLCLLFFLLSFLLSSPSSSFLSLLSFFPPSFLPSFLLFLFSVNKICVIFCNPRSNLYFQSGGGGGKVLIIFQPKNPPSFLSFYPFFCQ